MDFPLDDADAQAIIDRFLYEQDLVKTLCQETDDLFDLLEDMKYLFRPLRYPFARYVIKNRIRDMSAAYLEDFENTLGLLTRRARAIHAEWLEDITAPEFDDTIDIVTDVKLREFWQEVIGLEMFGLYRSAYHLLDGQSTVASEDN